MKPEEFDRDKLFILLTEYGFNPEIYNDFSIKVKAFEFSFDISTIDRIMMITFDEEDKREIEGIFNIMVLLFELSQYLGNE